MYSHVSTAFWRQHILHTAFIFQSTAISLDIFSFFAMDLDRISSIKVDELKNLFCLHGLKTAGRKQELVARVFVAIETTYHW